MKESPSLHRVIVAVLLVCTSSGLNGVFAQNRVVRMSEVTLRKKAIKTVRPAYPEESRAHRAKGPSVASLEIDEQGAVATVDVLEAPDQAIHQAMRDAIKQWRFEATTIGGEPVRVKGKITFYFVLDGSEARVEDPKLN